MYVQKINWQRKLYRFNCREIAPWTPITLTGKISGCVLLISGEKNSVERLFSCAFFNSLTERSTVRNFRKRLRLFGSWLNASGIRLLLMLLGKTAVSMPVCLIRITVKRYRRNRVFAYWNECKISVFIDFSKLLKCRSKWALRVITPETLVYPGTPFSKLKEESEKSGFLSLE